MRGDYAVMLGVMIGKILSVTTVLAGVAALILTYAHHVNISREVFFHTAAASEISMIAVVVCGVIGFLWRGARWLFSGVAIVAASVMLGAAWTCGLLATLAQWGLVAVIVSFFFAGVGPIPAGFIAALVGHHWEIAFDIGMSIALGIATIFVCSIWADRQDKQSQGNIT